MFRSTSRRPSNPTSSPNLLHVIAWCAMFSSHCYIKEKEGENPPQLVQVFFVTSKDYGLQDQDQDLLHATAGGRVGAGKQSLECAQKAEADHRKKFICHSCRDSNPGPFDHGLTESSTLQRSYSLPPPHPPELLI